VTEEKASRALQSPCVQWSAGQPLSARFDDVYYSREDGLQEAQHVFIAGNDLPERWRTLAPGQRFTICETGFGTGLNFLCAAALWLECAPPGAVLHFVSAEKYPLGKDEIATALSAWPRLNAMREDYLAAYPPRTRGVHRRWLWGNRVCLTLVFDDAIDGFESLLASAHPRFLELANPAADAWFLDGFAPAKNPDLWSENLFTLIARFSTEKTTLATFTVARQVRDGLAGVGFRLAKRPGFGRKRDMLSGTFERLATTSAFSEDWVAPVVLRNSRNEPSWHLNLGKFATRREAVVIGAGIAGCSAAAALRKRGWTITLIDRHGEPGQEASGNPQGILYPKLSSEDSPLAAFGLHALSHAMASYGPYWRQTGTGQRSGVLVLPETETDISRFARLGNYFGGAPELVTAVDNAALRELAGVPLAAKQALFFPALGWIDPAAVCRWLGAGIECIAGNAAQLARDEKTGLWSVLDDAGSLLAETPLIILAAGFASATFEQCAHLPLRAIRGQISTLPANAMSQHLRTVICGSGYMAPPRNGVHTLGATYDIDDQDLTLRADDHRRNVAALLRTDPLLEALLPGNMSSQLGGRAAIRCATPDYLPLVGPAPDESAFKQRFAAYRRNARADVPLPGAWHRGLWVSCGYGSRGFTYAPLAAELLAAQICGEMTPLPRDLAMALNPARFIIRTLKRNGDSQT